MAAASFLTTRATLFDGARARLRARASRPTPCAVARAKIRPAPRSGGTIRDVPFPGAPRPLTVGLLSASSRGFRALVSTRASGDAAGGERARPGGRLLSAVVVAADDASSAPPPSDDAPSEDEAADAAAAETDAPPTFAELGLPKSLCAALEATGFEEPSLPQCAAIPALLAGNNVALQSRTGSGKPMVVERAPRPRAHRRREPARERAVLGRALPGGGALAGACDADRAPGGARAGRVRQEHHAAVHWRRQRAEAGGGRSAASKPLLVVGTPGRLAELSRNGILRTHGVRCLVIDEADDLLASNFRRDMARICDHTGKVQADRSGRQTVYRAGALRSRDPAAARMAPNLKQIACGGGRRAPHLGETPHLTASDDEIDARPRPRRSPPNLERRSVVADARRKSGPPAQRDPRDGRRARAGVPELRAQADGRARQAGDARDGVRRSARGDEQDGARR